MFFAVTPALGQKQNPPKASVPRFSLALQLLTDTGDLDATSYLDDVQKSVKDKALATLPKPVSHGDQGIVIIRFEIQEDGNLASKVPPKFIFPSGKKELDDHAMAAISAAAPFHPLPEPLFSGLTLSVQLTFYYNIAPPQRR
jgi:TonB family protein